MRDGFQLRALTVIGRGKKPAELTFHPGLNVISGASNTGKSYVLQCLDYAMGAGTPPKQITESFGYESVVLAIEDNAGIHHTLTRSLASGDIRHTWGRANKQEQSELLGAKHSHADEATISGLLLKLCDGWDRMVKKNKSGGLRTLSFRDLAHLSLIDEMKIIGNISPALSGQNTGKTEETSVFKLLLTGVDDSSVITKETPKEKKARQTAQLDLVEKFIAQVEEQQRQLDGEPASVIERRQKIDDTISSHLRVLSAREEQISAQEKVRKEAWENYHALTARQNAAQELRSRFSLLEQHYESDLARLRAIIELDHYFAQLKQIRCPLCGASSDKHDQSDHGPEDNDSLAELRTACAAEIKKIEQLLHDLSGTNSALDSEISDLRHQSTGYRSTFQAAAEAIKSQLNPEKEQLSLQLTGIMAQRDRLAQVESLNTRLEELYREKQLLTARTSRSASDEPDPTLGIAPQAIEDFSLEVQQVLRDWRYPGLTRVTFNTQKMDLIISGKERASEGKGFRAIGYAAFIIGLMKYCTDSKMKVPHPGFVVLDSPLVTYRRRDVQPGEAIPENVSVAFYESLAKLPDSEQLLILENEDPPEHLQPKIHYVHFSRNEGVGRYGFFPRE